MDLYSVTSNYDSAYDFMHDLAANWISIQHPLKITRGSRLAARCSLNCTEKRTSSKSYHRTKSSVGVLSADDEHWKDGIYLLLSCEK
jgi:hypothetical protein